MVTLAPIFILLADTFRAKISDEAANNEAANLALILNSIQF